MREAAIADLRSAANTVKDGKPRPPGWVTLIEGASHFDLDHLTAVRDDAERRPLARVLLFQVVEDAGAASLLQKAADAVLEDSPDCYRVLDTICVTGSLGVLHQATEQGPKLLQTSLPDRLRALPDLPDSATAALNDINERDGIASLNKMLAALTENGAIDKDHAELSRSALADLIRETRFLQIYRRSDFMRRRWAVPVNEYLALALPAIADHPYRTYLEIPILKGEAIDDARMALRKIINPAEVELTQAHHLSLMLYDPEADGERNPGPVQAFRHQDNCYRDLAGSITQARGIDRIAAAHRMLAASAKAPLGKAFLIENEWAFAEAHAAEWEKDNADSPSVQGALGRRYTDMKRADCERQGAAEGVARYACDAACAACRVEPP